MDQAKRAELNKLYEDVASLYQYVLTEAEIGDTKYHELLDNGLTEETIKEFRLGMAPSKEVLQDYLLNHKHGPRAMLESGLFKQTARGTMNEIFKNEIVIPISNGYGKAMGFTSVNEINKTVSITKPQYLLFNYYQSLKALEKQENRRMYLISDPLNLIYAKQAGIDSIVAPLIDDLTPSQVRNLEKSNSELILVTDVELKNTVKRLETLESIAPEIHCSVIDLPGEKTVREYIKDNGNDSFRAFLEQSENKIRSSKWHLNYLYRTHNLNLSEERKAYMQKVIRVIASEYDLKKRSEYVQILSKQLNESGDKIQKRAEYLRNSLIKNNLKQKKKREDKAFRNSKIRHDKSFFQQSIKRYLDMQGISYTQQGHYLRLNDHDSLVIDTRITPDRPYESWFWNSRGVGGDLYKFLEIYERLDKKTAFERLQKLVDTTPVSSKEVRKKRYDPNEWLGVEEKTQSINYLVNKRKLDKKLVDDLFSSGLIRQLENNAIFFSWKDENGKEVGGDQQGTWIDHRRYGKRGTFKQIVEGSKEDFGFHFGSPLKVDQDYQLYVFESPIDALSFYQMHHKKLPLTTQYLSLSGAGTKVNTIKNLLERNKETFKILPSEIHICFDQDEGGRRGIKKALTVLNKFQYEGRIGLDHPGGSVKDWNEALQQNNFGHEVKNIDSSPRKEGIKQQNFSRTVGHNL